MQQTNVEQGSESGPLVGRVVVVLENAVYMHEGRMWTPFSWWKFGESLGDFCRSMTLYVPIIESPPPAGSIPSGKSRLVVMRRELKNKMEEK